MKFLHTMGAIGLMGAMASFLVLLSIAPPPADLEAYALVRSAMDRIARWIFLPSLVLTLIAGLGARSLLAGMDAAEQRERLEGVLLGLSSSSPTVRVIAARPRSIWSWPRATWPTPPRNGAWLEWCTPS